MKRISGLFSLIFLIIASTAITALAVEKVYFYHTDPAGTPLTMTDENNTVVWKADYRPFGEEQSINPQTKENDMRFVGKEKDTESGLQYFGARYMKDEIGRFITVDPVGPVDPRTSKTSYSMLTNPQRLNRYAYSLNNPYRYLDPDGRDIAFVVDPKGAGGNGHTSLYFQDASGRWHRFDQGAAGAPESSGKSIKGNLGYLMGMNAPAGVMIESGVKPSDGALIIKTSVEQDERITMSAVSSANEHDVGRVKYNLYSNNCTDEAIDVVNKSGAGLTIPNPWSIVKPNTWFEFYKNWYNSNPQLQRGQDE